VRSFFFFYPFLFRNKDWWLGWVKIFPTLKSCSCDANSVFFYKKNKIENPKIAVKNRQSLDAQVARLIIKLINLIK
jgi:hypothetical protein